MQKLLTLEAVRQWVTLDLIRSIKQILDIKNCELLSCQMIVNYVVSSLIDSGWLCRQHCCASKLLLAQGVLHLSKSNHRDLFSGPYFGSATCPALAVRRFSKYVQCQSLLLRPPTQQSGVFSCPVRSPLVIMYMQLPPLLLYDPLFNSHLPH